MKSSQGKRKSLRHLLLWKPFRLQLLLFMNIQQLSNNIDQKLAQLDQQLAQLHAQLTAAGDNREQLLKDKAALEQIKSKLQKSRAIMWQAHELQSGTDQKRLREKRWLGIGLCLVSGVGLIVLAFLVFAK